MSESAEFISRNELKHTKMLLDTFHINIEEANFAKCVKTNAAYIAYLHAADSNRMGPSKGHIDFARLFLRSLKPGTRVPSAQNCCRCRRKRKRPPLASRAYARFLNVALRVDAAAIRVQMIAESRIIMRSTGDVHEAIMAMLARHKLDKGCILHSDRDRQYTLKSRDGLIATVCLRQSFSRVAMPRDNVWSESFFATMKKESIHWTHYETKEAVRAAVFE